MKAYPLGEEIDGDLKPGEGDGVMAEAADIADVAAMVVMAFGPK